MGSAIDRFLERHEGGQRDTIPPSPTTPTARLSDVDRWLDAKEKSSVRLDTSLQLGTGQNPDSVAHLLKLHKRTGLPTDVVKRQLPAIEARTTAIDTDALRRNAPHTASWIAEHPNHASVARDDIPALTRMEQIFIGIAGPRFMSPAFTAVFGARAGAAESRIGRIGYEAIQRGGLNEAQRRELEHLEREIGAQPEGRPLLDRLIFGSAKMVGQMAHGIPFASRGFVAGAGAGLAGGPAAPITATTGAVVGTVAGLAAYSYQVEAGHAYLDLSRIKDEQGNAIDEDTRQSVALGVGAVNGLLETAGQLGIALPFRTAAKKLMREAVRDALAKPTMRAALVDLGKSYGIAMASEVGTEIAQEMSNIIGEELATWSQDGQFPTLLTDPEEREGAIWRLAQIARETAEGMALLALPGASIHGASSAYAAHKAQQRERYYLALGEDLAESKTLERYPEGVEAIVGRATENATWGLPVEQWDTYFQSKQLDPAVVAEEIGIREQWEEAQRTGGDIAIPAAKYATKIAPTEHNAFFARELRARPTEMNAREADEYRAQVAEQEAETAAQGAAPLASAERIREIVTEQLVVAGYDPATAQTNAAQMVAFFRTQAAREGMDPLALFERYNFSVTRAEEPSVRPIGRKVDLAELANRALSMREQRAEREAIQTEEPPSPYEGKAQKRDLAAKTTEGEYVFARTPGGPLRTNLASVSIDGLIDELARLLEANQIDRDMMVPSVIGQEGSGVGFVSVHVGMKGRAINASGRVASRTKSIAKVEAELERRGVTDVDTRLWTRMTGQTALAPDEEEFTAFQALPGGEEPRGSISFKIGEEAAVSIELLADADLSTFLHESGHFYLEVMRDLASRPNANPDVLRDFKTIKRELGWQESQTAFTREQHETFARLFEAYLMEGKAPSAELRSAFARFRAWLVGLYRSFGNLQVFLSDDVRQVFDRLLASEEEIAAAQREQKMEPLFTDPAAVGMSAAEATRYSDLLARHQHAAEDEIMGKLIADMQREQSAIYQAERAKVREEVAAEVNQERDSLAVSLLSRGRMPDGSPLPAELEAFKLSKVALQAEYESRYPNLMPRLRRFFLYSKEGGLHPDQAAEFLGYSSGDELIQALLAVEEGPKQRIERLTDEQVRAEDPNLVTPAELPEEAMKAVHNEERSKVLQLELETLASDSFAAFKGLAKRISRRLPLLPEVREQAERIVRNKRVGSINRLAYQRAEVKAARLASDAFFKGDIETAFDEKLREQLNHELYRAATKAQEEVDRVVTDLARFGKASIRERLGKAGGDFLAQIDGLLERFDFRRSVTGVAIARRRSLLDWYNEQVAEGLAPIVPQALLDEANRRHYKELTLAELRDVHETITSIEHLARLKNRLLANKEHRELEEAAALGDESIREHAKGKRATDIETRLPQTTAARAAQSWFAAHRKYSSLVRQMDGFDENGAMWQLLVRPINEAGAAEASRNEQATVVLHQLFFGSGAYRPADMKAMYRKEVVPDTNVSLTKMGRIVAALNAGNEINRRRVMEGYNWSPATYQKILDTLDERDLKFVQGVLDHFETYWAELEALGRDLHGVPPRRVEAIPIVTRAGTIPGGYFPIAFDDRQSYMAYKHDAEHMANRIRRGAAVRSRTERGMLEERVEGKVKAEIRLDFGVIFEHVSEVIHTITHTRTLQDVNRILGHERIRGAIYEHYGDVIYKQLLGTLDDIAAGDLGAQTIVEQGLGWIRQGATITGLGWSTMTSLLQPLGLFNSAVRIGPKWVGRGLVKWIGSARRMEGSVAWVHERSAFMRTRHKTMQREINEIRNTVGVTTGRLTGWVDEALRVTTQDAVTRQGIADSYFWLIGRMQMLADVPTWLGQYEKQMAAGLDEETAIQLADQAVLDSQGGGQIKDLAQVQRGGPLLKIWTNFYSYWNVVYQQLAESRARTNFKNPVEVGRLGVDFLLLVTFPAVAGMLLREAVRGEDDDEELWRRIGREHLSYLSGLMLGTRELSGTIQGYYGYEGPAGARFFAQLSNLVRQVSQWEADAAFWKALNEASGILFHYPAAQVNRTVAGIAALTQGDTRNPLVLLFGPPRE